VGQGHRSPGQGQQLTQLAPIEAQQPAQLAPIEAPGRSKHLGERSRSSAADRAQPIERQVLGPVIAQPGASIEPGLGSGFLNWFGYAVCELLGDRSPVCSEGQQVTFTHGRRRRDRSTR